MSIIYLIAMCVTFSGYILRNFLFKISSRISNCVKNVPVRLLNNFEIFVSKQTKNMFDFLTVHHHRTLSTPVVNRSYETSKNSSVWYRVCIIFTHVIIKKGTGKFFFCEYKKNGKKVWLWSFLIRKIHLLGTPPSDVNM